MDPVRELLEDCQSLLGIGQAKVAAKRLARVNAAKVPRRWRLELARVCRRAGLNLQGLRILQSVSSPSPEEQTECAALLLKLGASTEALNILKKLGSDAPFEAEWFRALAHLHRWDQENARLALGRFLARAPQRSTSPVSKTMAQLRLAQVLITQGHHRASIEALAEAAHEARASGAIRHLGQVHLLRAQLHFQTRDLAAAQQELQCFAEAVGPERAAATLAYRKYEGFLKALKTNSAEPLRQVRGEALGRRDYEAVREIDFLSLQVEFNKTDFDYLIFGTPVPEQRDYFCQALRRLPEANEFLLGSAGTACLNLSTGEVEGSTLTAPGRQVQQLIDALARDFYQPLQLGTLFSELFPREDFDAATSPHRVRQVILRARGWLKESGLPVVLSSAQGLYSLTMNGPFSLKVPLDRRPVERFAAHVETLRLGFSDVWGFSAREARTLLNLSSTGFKRFASWALENGHLERHGASSATFYRLVSNEAGGRSAA